MSNKKKSKDKDLSPAEKMRMICDIQTLGKMLLALNGGKDIPFTCVDGRGSEFIGGRK